MNFISLDFALFVPIVFVLYWYVVNKNLRLQNLLLLLASYFFYAWWDWHFLFLIILSTTIDYIVGLQMGATNNKAIRKRWLWLSIVFNVGMLAFFKYFNFFIDSFEDAFSILGHPVTIPAPHIILPIGISFYTLQTLSYTIDVYDQKIKPTRDYIAFAAYVSFFPQLVAGPIERATHFLPQFFKFRKFDRSKAEDGLRQVLWGIFKKTVVADNLILYCMESVAHPENHTASTLLLTTILGTIRIYCDFSAYSDIAIGTARLFGFDIMKNFDYPLFARNMSEFWQKWHISLITWIRDYIGRRLIGGSKKKIALNIFVIFFLTGLWHGANWTYIIWGILHFMLFLPMIFYKRTRYRKSIAYNKFFPSVKEVFNVGKTILLFSLIGVLFENPTVSDALNYYSHMINTDLLSIPELPKKSALLGIAVLIGVEWLQRDKNHGLELDTREIPKWIRWIIYYILIALIAYFGGEANDFIYFQF